MVRQRSLVDYSLRRRAVLADLRRGVAARADVCDANVYLLRAARYHGEETRRRCPVCAEALTDVHFVYGDALGRIAGQAHRVGGLDRLVEAHGSFTVYVVEVCRACAWNHLVKSYIAEETGEPGAGAGQTGAAVRQRPSPRRVKV